MKQKSSDALVQSMALARKRIAVSATSASLPRRRWRWHKRCGRVLRVRRGSCDCGAQHGAKSGRALAMSHITRPRIKSERVKDVLAFLVALALTLFIKLV